MPLDYPYVTVEEFRKHPHYLDLDTLLIGESEALQTSTIREALMFASTWADTELAMPLGAHVRTEHARVRADRRGVVHYHPEHAPVIKVVGLAVGGDPDALDEIAEPKAWTEQDGRTVHAYGPGGPTLGALQFGSPSGPDEMLARWTYVAGWPATQLAVEAVAAQATITVRSAVGIEPGTVLRLWTPGVEEAVTVASISGATVTLSAPLQATHPVGMSCSAIPPDARMAVIKMACAKLLRKGPLAESAGRPPSGGPSPHASSGDPKRTTAAGNYHQHACGLLAAYKRVR